MSRDAIESLVHRYADAVVHRDQQAWTATWAPDAVWALGTGNRVAGREAISGLWAKAMDGFTAVVHTVLNGDADVDEVGSAGTGAGTGRWYVQEALRLRDGTNMVMLGHYDDLYRCVDGVWLFQRRELVVHYQGPPDFSGVFPNEIADAAT